MNPLDLAVVAIVALSAVFAFARGFVREALSIVAWVGAGVITLYGFTWVFNLVDQRVHNTLLSQVITGFGLFLSSLVVLTVLTGFVARMVHLTGLTPIDRTLGFIFGLARGLLLVCLAYLLLDLTLPQANDRPSWIRDAKSGPYLHEGADVLKGFVPESLKSKSTEAAGEFWRTVNPRTTAKTETDKAIRALQTPAPAATPVEGAAPAPNYPPGDRRELDRVIGTQRQ
jgi:membrane protein required for colicin V production